MEVRVLGETEMSNWVKYGVIFIQNQDFMFNGAKSGRNLDRKFKGAPEIEAVTRGRGRGV